MWAYTWLAFFTISSPIPWLTGVCASLVHLLSPLLYRYTQKVWFACSVMIVAGMIHQATFAYFSGGFMGSVIIWFGILPFVAALVVGPRFALVWALISLTGTAIFFALRVSEHNFPQLITPTGRVWAQAFITFGWIFLSSSLSIFYLSNENKKHRALSEHKDRVENLFRILCHDLGNPLALVEMGLQQMRSDLPQEKKERALTISTRAVESMGEIIRNVRQMYAVQEGKTEVICQPMSLHAAIDEAEFLFKEAFKQKELQVEYDRSRPDTVLMVEPISFVHQVLGNIISNAIKFSEPRSLIRIQVTPGAQGHVQLTISDQGIGMPDWLRQQLFNIKSHVSRPGTSGEHGTGLGMYLMKTFVEKYGGHVHVNSQENQGTTFVLTLKGGFA